MSTAKPPNIGPSDTTGPGDNIGPSDTTGPSDNIGPSDTTGPGDAAEPGYAAAMAELEQILQELEGEDPDVDVLANRVERAATLIEICRRRIANASVQVERVVTALESDGAT